MSNLETHAFDEFLAAGWIDANGTFKCDMQGEICKHVLALLAVFDSEGHSGSSAPYAIDLFSKLAKFEPITPLTGDDWEWNDIGDGYHQNNRCSHVFKSKSRFDGKPYDMNAVIFWEWYTNPETGEKFKTYFTSGDSARVIEFPYTPKSEYQEAI